MRDGSTGGRNVLDVVVVVVYSEQKMFCGLGWKKRKKSTTVFFLFFCGFLLSS